MGRLGKMAGIDFNALRNTITMEEVLRKIGFEPVSRTGDQLHGPCFIHGSSSPSSKTFSVNLRIGRYYCHKCGSKGNQLELWTVIHKLTIYDAAVDLCRALGRDVPWITRW
jgi:DNA primase